MTALLEILDCGHPPTPSAGPGTGLARLRDNSTVCYECADEKTRLYIATAQGGDRVPLYADSEMRLLTSWTGGEMMRITRLMSLHGWSKERRYIQAIDPRGFYWFGTAAPGMWATMRKMKS